MRERLKVLTRARHGLAKRRLELAAAIPSSLARSRADTFASEVLPLLEACRFLERGAERILRAKRLGRRGLPFWLRGVISTVERVPLGTVLVIGPANYPLFLPGVQVLQGLAAANAVVWKPGNGGAAVATIVADVLTEAGLPDGLLRISDESAEQGAEEIRRGPNKIFFTGSGAVGRAVLRAAAETATPVVAELSGCDAVVVLPSAQRELVAAGLEFGMRLNGSATCMAPRRLMLIGEGHDGLLKLLQERFNAMPGVLLREHVRAQVRQLTEDAAARGANVVGDVHAEWMKPLLVLGGGPEMQVARTDVFAPVLTVMHFADSEEMLRADASCPFGLTAVIFGEEQQARALGARMKVGVVLINDMIVPTVDPRVSFGGRRASGFGVTRGAEGLLEMTAVRPTLVRRGNDGRHFQATTEAHEELFHGAISMGHGRGLRERLDGLRRFVNAAKGLR